MRELLTAERFITEIESYRSAEELKKYERYFPLDMRGDDQFIGVRMEQVFVLAKSVRVISVICSS